MNIKVKKSVLFQFIEAAPIPMYYKNTDGEYLFCNNLLLKLLEIDNKSVLIGKTAFDVFTKDCAIRYTSLDKELYKGKNQNKALRSYIIGQKTKKEIQVVFYKSIVKNKNGLPKGIIGAILDATEQVNVQEELARKDELLFTWSKQASIGELISIIAHQWRQPLAAINMMLNNLRADLELETFDEQEAIKTFDKIELLVQHLSMTINDFRDFFKKDKEKDFVNINDVINEALNIISSSLKNSDINIKMSLKSTKKIPIYKREILQTLLNIIKNAQDAIIENCVEQAKIVIKTKDHDNEVEITISDNAGGIDKDVIGKIFDVYFTTKEQASGTGLGLYMAMTIISQRHKGKLYAVNYNGGAKFIIRLPILKPLISHQTLMERHVKEPL